jgi:hypothetical protein
MSENYITIEDKLIELGVEYTDKNLHNLDVLLKNHPLLTVVGYQPNEGGKDLPLYDNSEALEDALRDCDVPLPKKEIEAAVEVKKKGRPKTEQIEEA